MKNKIKSIRDLFFSAFRDKRFFYARNICSFSLGWLLYANLQRPSRLFRSFTHIQSTRFGILQILMKRTQPEIEINVIFDHNNPDNSFSKIDLALKTHGAVVIEGYFNTSIIEKFSQVYKNEISKIKSQESRFGDPLVLSKELLDLWLDPSIYQIHSRYFGTTPYCRSYPMLHYIDKNSTQEFRASKKGISSEWHVDHCTIVPQMIYLAEVRPSGTCMEIVSGSHNYPNVPLGFWSEEYIENCGLEIKKLTGPIGSIQLHNANVVHRAYPVNGSDRLTLNSSFCWGENILFDVRNVLKMLLNSDITLDTLTPMQKEAMLGIFPDTPFKGYQIKNGYLTPQVSQGI